MTDLATLNAAIHANAANITTHANEAILTGSKFIAEAEAEIAKIGGEANILLHHLLDDFHAHLTNLSTSVNMATAPAGTVAMQPPARPSVINAPLHFESDPIPPSEHDPVPMAEEHHPEPPQAD